MSAILKVDDLRVSFATEDGVVQAVSGVSFELQAGEVLAIVGESGSGKSVTAQTITGLTRAPNARITGSVTYRGRELNGLDDDQLRDVRGEQIAMVFQDPMTSLNPVYRVGDQITEMIRAHRDVSKREAADRAVELLRSVGIPNPERRVRHYPHEFSGGMRQRVMIAMALALEPDVLIADEPTTALDVTVQAQILRLIDQLNRDRDLAVILITHDLGVVAEVADRVRGHVRRPDRRECDARRDLLRPAAPLHLGTARFAHAARSIALSAAGADPGAAPVAAGAASGLPVRSPLSRTHSTSATSCPHWKPARAATTSTAAGLTHRRRNPCGHR